jgi:glycosyltransferase involved in cell wall biosynthesis
VTSWNTRCGIANYSAHLIEKIPSGVTIFATKTADITQQDGPEVLRCWSAGEEDTLDELAKNVADQQIDTLVVQFNYGFFNLERFNSFLSSQLNAGRVVVVTMHSTVDPAHVPNKRLEIIRESLARCHRILVHSPADLNRLKTLGLIANVALFPHGIRDYLSPQCINNKLTLPSKKNRFTLASYGFFLPHKGLLELIEVVGLLNQWGVDVRLSMINAEYPVPESAALIQQAKAKISALGLSDRVRMTTEFLPDDESLALLSAADLIVFPYQDTGESSSAAVRNGLVTGRPVAVTPLSIFDDVAPAVFKLPGLSPNEIARGIIQLIHEITHETELTDNKKIEAARWREVHRYARLGHRLYGLLQALAQQNCSTEPLMP